DLTKRAALQGSREDLGPRRPVGRMSLLVLPADGLARLRLEGFRKHVDAVEQVAIEVFRFPPSRARTRPQTLGPRGVSIDLGQENRKDPRLDVSRVLRNGHVEEPLRLRDLV